MLLLSFFDIQLILESSREQNKYFSSYPTYIVAGRIETSVPYHTLEIRALGKHKGTWLPMWEGLAGKNQMVRRGLNKKVTLSRDMNMSYRALHMPGEREKVSPAQEGPVQSS